MLIHLHSNYPTKLLLVSYTLPQPWLLIKALALLSPCLQWATLGFWVTLCGPLEASCLPLAPMRITNPLISHVSPSVISMAKSKWSLRTSQGVLLPHLHHTLDSFLVCMLKLIECSAGTRVYVCGSFCPTVSSLVHCSIEFCCIFLEAS